MPQINKVHTSCKNCIFALYKDITQFGCKINKLAMWQEQGIQILEAYDEEKEFNIMNDRICPYKRNAQWGTIYHKDVQIEQVNKEVSLRYHAIIVSNDNIADIEQTISSIINNQSVAPKEITILCMYGQANSISYELQNVLKHIKVPWKAQVIVDEQIELDHAIDLAITFCQQQYYGVFFAGSNIPSDTIESIDALVKAAIQVVLIEGNSTGHGKFVHTLTHKVLKGNKVDDLNTKIHEQADKNLIRKITDLCPSFPK